MKKVLSLLIIGMFCMTFASAVWYNPWTWFDDQENNTQQEGKLFIINNSPEWNVIKATEEESDLIFWTDNSKDKKTEIGWIPKDGSCSNKIDKNIYYENGEQIVDDKGHNIKLKCKNKGCDGQDCYYIKLKDSDSVNIDEYVKLGEHSFVTEYQDINTLNYDLGWSDTNVTLFKNISGSYSNTVNSIWIKYNNDSYKFGATDLSNEDIESYKYQIKSNVPIYLENWVAYIKNPEKIMNKDSSYYETHEFDFKDICSRGFHGQSATIDNETWIIYNDTANCEFDSYEIFNRNETVEFCDETCENITTQIYDYYLEVTFVSDMDIDPEITIGSSDWATTSLLTNVTAEAGNFTHLDISGDDPYDSLVLYMPFDVNTSSDDVTYDWSGEGNDGTCTNCPIWNSSGKYGGAYEWADSDAVKWDVGDLDVEGNDMTVSAWIKHVDADFNQNNAHIVSKWDSYVLRIWDASNPGNGYDFGVDGSSCASGNDTYAFNEWVYLTGTYDGIDVRIYVNGELENTCAKFGSIPSNDNNLLIGDYQGAGYYFKDGSIDEVMIFNTSLNSTQILEIYNNQSARFLPEGTQKVRAVNITNSTTWDNNGYNRVNLTSTVQENLDSSIEARIGQFNFSVDPDGLVLYMPFEWGSAVDISGVGNDGVVTNATWNKTGGVNETGAFNFDGIDDDFNDGDYIDMGSDSSLNFNGAFTVSSWIKPGVTDNWDRVIQRASADGNGFSVRVNTNYFAFQARQFSINTNAKYDSFYNVDQWYHVVGVYDGSSISLYVDNVLQTTTVSDNAGDGGGTNLNFGRRANFDSQYFNGSIDEVMIFNRALTPTEISQMYNESVAKHNIAYYTDYQYITSDTNEAFTISKEADFVFPEYKFLVGPNSSASFYSPIIQDDVDLDWYNAESGTPTISINRIFPTGNVNVTQNGFFKVELDVTCLTGNCGTVNVSLDPVETGTSRGLVTTSPTANPYDGSNWDTFDGRSLALEVVTTSNIIITEMGWYARDATQESNYEVAIYEHDSGNNRPGDIIYSSKTNAKGTSDGWKKVTGLTDWNLSASTTYWIAAQLDDTTSQTGIPGNSYSLGKKIDSSDTTLQDPWNSDTNAFYGAAIYALVESSTSKSGLINTTIGATPFYTNNTNPQTTTSLSAGQSETITFWVNATGEVDITHDFYAWANMTTNELISNVTDHWNVTIVAGAVGDTCICAGLETNWEINLADNCNIITDCNLSTGNLTFINEGSVLFNATLTTNKISWKDSVAVVEKYNLGNLFRGWIG